MGVNSIKICKANNLTILLIYPIVFNIYPLEIVVTDKRYWLIILNINKQVKLCEFKI